MGGLNASGLGQKPPETSSATSTSTSTASMTTGAMGGGQSQTTWLIVIGIVAVLAIAMGGKRK
jgi:hypothetical protein